MIDKLKQGAPFLVLFGVTSIGVLLENESMQWFGLIIGSLMVAAREYANTMKKERLKMTDAPDLFQPSDGTNLIKLPGKGETVLVFAPDGRAPDLEAYRKAVLQSGGRMRFAEGVESFRRHLQVYTPTFIVCLGGIRTP